MRLLHGLVCLTMMCGALAFAQNAPAKALAYDVVSIKPNDSGSGSVRTSADGERFVGTNVSLKMLLENAYGIKQDLISGVPKEVDGARFDILAKILQPDVKVWGKMNRAEKGELLRPMLVARFGLKVHVETRMLPSYELVVEKGGPKFKSMPVNEHTGHMSLGSQRMIGTGISMGALVGALADTIHRQVLDKTGLDGNYDIDLQWTPEGTDQSDGPPGIFTAVQDQLGLRLRAVKGPVQVLVVDSVTMPSPD